MRFEKGMFAAAIIIGALMVSIFGGYVLNAEVATVNVEKQRELADITGLFEHSEEPAYVDYNPASNITGYRNAKNSPYFGGAEYVQNTDADGNKVVNQYPVILQPTRSASTTMTLSSSLTQLSPPTGTTNTIWGICWNGDYIKWIYDWVGGVQVITPSYPGGTVQKPYVISLSTLITAINPGSSVKNLVIEIPDEADQVTAGVLNIRTNVLEDGPNKYFAHTLNQNRYQNITQISINLSTLTADLYSKDTKIAAGSAVDSIYVAYGGTDITLNNQISYYTITEPAPDYLDNRYGVKTNYSTVERTESVYANYGSATDAGFVKVPDGVTYFRFQDYGSNTIRMDGATGYAYLTGNLDVALYNSNGSWVALTYDGNDWTFTYYISTLSSNQYKTLQFMTVDYGGDTRIGIDTVNHKIAQYEMVGDTPVEVGPYYSYSGDWYYFRGYDSDPIYPVYKKFATPNTGTDVGIPDLTVPIIYYSSGDARQTNATVTTYTEETTPWYDLTYYYTQFAGVTTGIYIAAVEITVTGESNDGPVYWSNGYENSEISIIFDVTGNLHYQNLLEFEIDKDTGEKGSDMTEIFENTGKTLTVDVSKNNNNVSIYLTWKYGEYSYAALGGVDIGNWSVFIITYDIPNGILTWTGCYYNSWQQDFTNYREVSTGLVMDLNAAHASGYEGTGYAVKYIDCYKGRIIGGDQPETASQQVIGTKTFLNTYNVVMNDPSFDVNNYWPNMDDAAIAIRSVALYGNSVTFTTGSTYNVIDGTITVRYTIDGDQHIADPAGEQKTITLQNFVVVYHDNDVSVIFRDINDWTLTIETVNPSPEISFDGLWYFNAAVLETYTEEEQTYEIDWNNGTTEDKNAIILIFLGALIAGGIVCRLKFRMGGLDALILTVAAVAALCVLGGI